MKEAANWLCRSLEYRERMVRPVYNDVDRRNRLSFEIVAKRKCVQDLSLMFQVGLYKKCA